MSSESPTPLPPVVRPADLQELALRESALVLLDVRGGANGRAEFEARRLAGARFVDLESDLAGDASHPERGGRHPLPDLGRWCERLATWGIAPGTAVVIYDDAGGGNAAARAWWMVRAVGHERVALLDGGLSAAIAAGFPVESGTVSSMPDARAAEESLPPYPAQEWTLPRVDADEVERRRLDPDWRVVDVRSAQRYRGESEPFDPIAGCIPGAVNLPWTDLIDSEGNLIDADQIEQRLEQVIADVPPERTIVHCGSGVTACHTLVALEHAGHSGAALYVGSWSEWCRQPRPRLPEGGADEPGSEE